MRQLCGRTVPTDTEKENCKQSPELRVLGKRAELQETQYEELSTTLRDTQTILQLTTSSDSSSSLEVVRPLDEITEDQTAPHGQALLIHTTDPFGGSHPPMSEWSTSWTDIGDFGTCEGSNLASDTMESS